MNRQEQKELAVNAMKELNIDDSYIDQFYKEDIVTQFIQGMGYNIDERTEHDLLKHIQRVEEEFGICVYAVTHEETPFGECFSMLYISKYDEDRYYTLRKIPKENIFHAIAYVYNADVEWNSEFGTIGVMSIFGGISRVL